MKSLKELKKEPINDLKNEKIALKGFKGQKRIDIKVYNDHIKQIITNKQTNKDTNAQYDLAFKDIIKHAKKVLHTDDMSQIVSAIKKGLNMYGNQINN